MGLKPDAFVDQKSISRLSLLKTMWSQFDQEINFGMVNCFLNMCKNLFIKKPF